MGKTHKNKIMKTTYTYQPQTKQTQGGKPSVSGMLYLLSNES